MKKYKFMGEEVEIKDSHVYDKKTGECLGYCFTNNHFQKYLVGARHKGPIEIVQ